MLTAQLQVALKLSTSEGKGKPGLPACDGKAWEDKFFPLSWHKFNHFFPSGTTAALVREPGLEKHKQGLLKSKSNSRNKQSGRH